MLVSLGTAARAEPKVVVTIKPIHSLTAGIMAGIAEPRLLIDGAGSPHTFALKPSDARALNEADVVLRVSDTLEPFMDKVIKSLPKSVRVVALDATPNLTLFDLRTGGAFEAHGHGDKGHSHQHGKKGSGKAHDHNHDHAGGVDGHLWLDPANAKLMVAYIADVLATEMPEHTDRLKRNAAELSKKLDQLSEELDAMLKPVGDKRYIVFHDAYQYLERRYGLQPIGSVTISPDMAPSAKRLSELRRKITELKAVCIFAEPQFEPKLVRTIAEGSKVRSATLDPLGAAVPAGPDLYFMVLQTLASDLANCLGAAN
jgi:zinc transport system substrate-binding protein